MVVKAMVVVVLMLDVVVVIVVDVEIVVVVVMVGIIWFDAANCNIESQVLRTPVIPSKCPLFLSNPWQALSYKVLLFFSYKLLLFTQSAS